LLAKEAAIEGFERDKDFCRRVIPLKTLHGMPKDFIRAHLPANGIKEKKVMQFVRSEHLFCLLGGLACFVQRQQLG
jgi:hypothetical protein